jgi:uncharacterized membrane protein YeaQ/YmgE (transglycosylase-associated protein family)
MDPNMVSALISLVSGAVGGNAGGALSKANSMGPLWNSILGALGGLGGGQLAGAIGGLESMGQAGNVGTSAIIGAVLPIVIGMIKKKMA